MHTKAALRTLGISKTHPTVKEIKVAYLKQAAHWHPDRWDVLYKESATEKFKVIQQAYHALNGGSTGRRPCVYRPPPVPLGVNLGIRYTIMFFLCVAALHEKWRQAQALQSSSTKTT
mmetsp:Transcript_13967/g.23137  ORF Transcript_13967/g.23137 Transcript_13967/m.23137 type:complete len:117 (+) Transcript_13967:159-509(+)